MCAQGRLLQHSLTWGKLIWSTRLYSKCWNFIALWLTEAIELIMFAEIMERFGCWLLKELVEMSEFIFYTEVCSQQIHISGLIIFKGPTVTLKLKQNLWLLATPSSPLWRSIPCTCERVMPLISLTVAEEMNVHVCFYATSQCVQCLSDCTLDGSQKELEHKTFFFFCSHV